MGKAPNLLKISIDTDSIVKLIFDQDMQFDIFVRDDFDFSLLFEMELKSKDDGSITLGSYQSRNSSMILANETS